MTCAQDGWGHRPRIRRLVGPPSKQYAVDVAKDDNAFIEYSPFFACREFEPE
jgi:hypothetical protein